MNETTCLREIRRHRSLTTRQMARVAGVDQATISRIERGLVAGVRLATARKLATAYGVAIEVLIQGECS